MSALHEPAADLTFPGRKELERRLTTMRKFMLFVLVALAVPVASVCERNSHGGLNRKSDLQAGANFDGCDPVRPNLPHERVKDGRVRQVRVEECRDREAGRKQRVEDVYVAAS
jgi:hypothetical protein